MRRGESVCEAEDRGRESAKQRVLCLLTIGEVNRPHSIAARGFGLECAFVDFGPRSCTPREVRSKHFHEVLRSTEFASELGWQRGPLSDCQQTMVGGRSLLRPQVRESL